MSGAPAIKLYGYWRSSASWRARWGFELKRVAYEYVPVNILKREHKGPEHLRRNPLGALPVMEVNGTFVCESLAMLEWMDESFPKQGAPLYPRTPLERAQVRALCEIINSETGPLQTPRAQNRHSQDLEEKNAWARDFIREGLAAYDKLSQAVRGSWSFGDQVTAADICLIPQIYNALRYSIPVADEFPALHALFERALRTEECLRASPEKQIDAAPPS